MIRKLTVLATVLALSAATAALAGAASSPAVTTGAATNTSQTGGVLHGVVNPNGTHTGYQFDYGLTTAYGLHSRPRSAGHGTKPVPAAATVGGLLPGTVYHYRIAALNRYGATLGRDRTFKTKGNPPAEAATGPASSIGQTTATVTGEVTPHNQKTTWFFQYGLSTGYGVRTTSQSATGTATVPVATQLTGLAPGTLFHYRIVAVNRGIPSFGADSTFLTQPLQPVTPAVHATTSPRRDRHRPYVFTSSGSVVGPSSMPQQYVCFGQVAIHFLKGSRQVGLTVVAIQPDCTFSAQTVFNHKPVRHHRNKKLRLKVSINFRDNGYLGFARANLEHVTLG